MLFIVTSINLSIAVQRRSCRISPTHHPAYLRIKNQPSPTTVQTMTSVIRTKAYKLPELLSTLPRDGIGALVRPSTSPNSVYRVTRSKLKFRARSEVGEQSIKDGGKGDEMLAVSGKIWGMRFVNGMSSTSQVSGGVRD